MTDRVSQYLVANVIYGEGRSLAPDELFARIILFKLFNRIETWELIESRVGAFHVAIDREALAGALDAAFASGATLYSAAYIMPSPPLGSARKHRNHLALLFQMIDAGLPRQIEKTRSLAEVYRALLQWPGVGRFLAFQFAIDLNYSPLCDFDESDFVVAGPGALDGLAKCFGGISVTPERLIMQVCENQSSEFASRGISFDYLYGRPLKPIDCQNLFCEISKYARIKHPEFRGTQGRTRIKQFYKPRPQRLQRLVFPPKWLQASVNG